MVLTDVDLDLLDVDLATCDDSKKFLRRCFQETPMQIPANSILQLQSIFNMSVPEQDREVARKYIPGVHLLKVVLSDGDLNITALMGRTYSGFGLNTPPGTKIRLTETAKIINGTFSLFANNFEVLGGNVSHLIQSWIRRKKLNLKEVCKWNSENNEGPLWKSFRSKDEIHSGMGAVEAKVVDIDLNKREQPGQGDCREIAIEVQRKLEQSSFKQVNQKWMKPTINEIDEEMSELLREGLSFDDIEEVETLEDPKKDALHFKNFIINGQIKLEPSRPLKEKFVKDVEEDGDYEDALEYQHPTNDITLFSFIEPQLEVAAKQPDEINGDENSKQSELNALYGSASASQVENPSQSEDGEREFLPTVPTVPIATEFSQFENDSSVQNPMKTSKEDTTLDSTKFSWNLEGYKVDQKLPEFQNDNLSGSHYYKENHDHSALVSAMYRKSTPSRETDFIWKKPDCNETQKTSNYNRFNGFGVENNLDLGSSSSSFYKNLSYPSWKANGGRSGDLQPCNMEVQSWQKEMMKNPLLKMDLYHQRKRADQNKSHYQGSLLADFKRTEQRKSVDGQKMNFRRGHASISDFNRWRAERENSWRYEQAWDEDIINCGFSQYHGSRNPGNKLQKVRQSSANATGYRDRNYVKANRYDETPKRRSGISYRKDCYQNEYSRHNDNKRQGRQANPKNYEGFRRNESEIGDGWMYVKTPGLDTTDSSPFHSPPAIDNIGVIDTPDYNQRSWMPFDCNLFDLSSFVKSERRRQETFNTSSESLGSQSQQSSPSPNKPEYLLYQ